MHMEVRGHFSSLLPLSCEFQRSNSSYQTRSTKHFLLTKPSHGSSYMYFKHHLELRKQVACWGVDVYVGINNNFLKYQEVLLVLSDCIAFFGDTDKTKVRFMGQKDGAVGKALGDKPDYLGLNFGAVWEGRG